MEPSLLESPSREVFATQETLHSSLIYLQETLSSMGMCGNLNLLSTDPADVVVVANTLYGLLLQHQQDAQYKDGLKLEMARVRAEAHAAEKGRAKMEAKLEAKEREIGALGNKARAGDDARREEVGRARREVDELQKRILGSDRRLVQMQHEIKRKEKDYERLQERLAHYLADRKRNETAALDMAGQLAANAGGSVRPSTSSNVRSDEGIKAVVAAYEGRQAELVRENRDLRTVLSSLQAEYKEVLNAVDARREIEATAGPVLEDSFLAAVPHMGADELRAELSAKLRVLQRRLGSITWRAAEEGSSVAEQRMAGDMAIARSIIHDQEMLITSVLGALRSAQAALGARYQADVKALTQRYQAQLAVAEESLSTEQQMGAERLEKEIARITADAEQSIAELAKQRDAAIARAEKAESNLAIVDTRLSRTMDEAKKVADARIAAAVLEARTHAEAEKNKAVEGSVEIVASMKREQGGLRAEVAALRERLILEKAIASKAAAERKDAVEALDAKMAEIRGLSVAIEELRQELQAKNAELDALRLELRAAETRAGELIEYSAKERQTAERLAAVQIQEALETAAQEHRNTIQTLESERVEALDTVDRERNARFAAEQQFAALQADRETIVRTCAEQSLVLEELRVAEDQAQVEIHTLKQKLEVADTEAMERLGQLRSSLSAAHGAELDILHKQMVESQAHLLSKAEADLEGERQVFQARISSLEAKLKEREEGLRTEAEKLLEAEKTALNAEEAIRYYNQLTEQYKEMMRRYAPGLGAGLFLERAIARRSTDVMAA